MFQTENEGVGREPAGPRAESGKWEITEGWTGECDEATVCVSGGNKDPLFPQRLENKGPVLPGGFISQE